MRASFFVVLLPLIANALNLANINSNIQGQSRGAGQVLINPSINNMQINSQQSSLNPTNNNGFIPFNLHPNSLTGNIPRTVQQQSLSVMPRDNNPRNNFFPDNLNVNSLAGNIVHNVPQTNSPVNPRNTVFNGAPSNSFPSNSVVGNMQINSQQTAQTGNNLRNNDSIGFRPDLFSGIPGLTQSNFNHVTKPPITTKPLTKNPFVEIPSGLGGMTNEELLPNKYQDERTCFRYDRRFQTKTLEEAILNFPDLTMTNWRLSDLADSNTCNNDQCKTCADFVLQKLEHANMIDGRQSENFRNVLNVGDSNSFRTTQQCPRLSVEKRLLMSNSKNFRTENGDGSDKELDLMVKKLKDQGNSRQSFSRVKKSAVEKNLLGQSFKLKCVSRGEPADQQNQEWVSLCTMCWVWRRLPDQYYPQYVNELVCDSDSRCLSGWGSCQQGSKNIDVLKKVETNVGNFTWIPLTIESLSTCSCQVKAGSALHILVSG